MTQSSLVRFVALALIVQVAAGCGDDGSEEGANPDGGHSPPATVCTSEEQSQILVRSTDENYEQALNCYVAGGSPAVLEACMAGAAGIEVESTCSPCVRDFVECVAFACTQECTSSASECRVCGLASPCSSSFTECGTELVVENDAGTPDGGAGCAPDCAARQCGSDGCGGDCGVCSGGETCNTSSGQCQSTCTPDCAGKGCGADGCGGNCGVCGAGEVCDGAGLCEAVCTPDCAGKVCGSDGCGGDCGSCSASESCDGAGQCQSACTPLSTRCSGDYLQQCGGGSTWGTPGTLCANGCQTSGGAHCGTCSPGDAPMCAGSNVQNCSAEGEWYTSQSCSNGCSAGACQAAQRLIFHNDLVTNISAWDDVNNIVVLRIASTENGALNSGTTDQLGYLEMLSVGGSRTIDVSSWGTSYSVYYQAGWWEHFCPNSCSWIERLTTVGCCDCTNTCYKASVVNIDGHTAGDFHLYASDFLTVGNWCGSPFPYCG